MRALSIRQPWAWLITHGHKNIENRTWRTNYRGPVLIHTGQKVDRWARFTPILLLADACGVVTIPRDLPLGGIVGVATLVDCVTESESPWFKGPYGFELCDARPLPFVACPGRLNIFRVDSSILSTIQRSLTLI